MQRGDSICRAPEERVYLSERQVGPGDRVLDPGQCEACGVEKDDSGELPCTRGSLEFAGQKAVDLV